jgi:hypothetical protein
MVEGDRRHPPEKSADERPSERRNSLNGLERTGQPKTVLVAVLLVLSRGRDDKKRRVRFIPFGFGFAGGELMNNRLATKRE